MNKFSVLQKYDMLVFVKLGKCCLWLFTTCSSAYLCCSSEEFVVKSDTNLIIFPAISLFMCRFCTNRVSFLYSGNSFHSHACNWSHCVSPSTSNR